MWIIDVILFLLILFSIYSIYRLNIYIEKLEEILKKKIQLVENLNQSLKDIVAEDALNNDGRLKKYNIQKERNFIYNGIKADEDNYEI